ncbi:MAG: helix-turn-helix domain-containing protein [Halofilum sp. (in: g-proteobacteria)]|nr:helix-turn-helix domain-containing protein [Halofilum sp. (in: g-proteobacteria)]
MNVIQQPDCGDSVETPLRRCVFQELDRYFNALEGQQPCDLYKMVIRETEQALLQYVLAQTRGNQCRAASLLGMNRGTLRKKLDFYGIGR